MKGYGRSDRQDHDYNWHHVAQQIADLMDNLGIRRFFVVSHDWGSVIGSVLVSDYPDHIPGFVRMEADLVPPGTGGWVSFFFRKPQWILFQSSWFATCVMPAGSSIPSIPPHVHPVPTGRS